MSFDEVVTLNQDEASVLGAMLDHASAWHKTVRVAIDEGGVKIACGRESWTPAIGSLVDGRVEQ